MTISIKISDSCKTLGEVCTQVNNALSARIRKLKKRGGNWPHVRLLYIHNGEVFYEVTQA